MTYVYRDREETLRRLRKQLRPYVEEITPNLLRSGFLYQSSEKKDAKLRSLLIKWHNCGFDHDEIPARLWRIADLDD